MVATQQVTTVNSIYAQFVELLGVDIAASARIRNNGLTDVLLAVLRYMFKSGYRAVPREMQTHCYALVRSDSSFVV